VIPPSVRIFVCAEPVDLRRGFDGLALIARQTLEQDPRSGALFVFVNRRRNRLKALWWDRNGYCLLYKRLHDKRFELPVADGSVVVRIEGAQLGSLLLGTGNVRRRARKPRLVH